MRFIQTIKILSVLSTFSVGSSFAAGLPCGETGKVSERMAACSAQQNAKKNGWVLVTRTKRLKEVWKDPQGNLWGDRFSRNMHHWSAESACEGTKEENGNITDVSFRLPTKEEYLAAANVGIRGTLPNMTGNQFWSSSKADDPSYAWQFLKGDVLRNNEVSVRCVGGPVQ